VRRGRFDLRKTVFQNERATEVSVPTQLYRHYDKDGQLLYVGISLSAVSRLSQHKEKPWYTEIATVTIETLPTRAHALRAERRAIWGESPRYNVAGTSDLSVDDIVDLAKLINDSFETGEYEYLFRVAGGYEFRWPGLPVKFIRGDLNHRELFNRYYALRLECDNFIGAICDGSLGFTGIIKDGKISLCQRYGRGSRILETVPKRVA
jgi:hypothetical protein